ncbi:gp53-like domain-containing protein [Escherichia coli]
MYHVDNSTGVPVMPQPSPVTSETELFFTEGGNGVPPTFPGPDWFNIIQSELINILRAAGLDPDKMDNTQILAALKKLFLSRSNPFGDIKADGAAAIATALSNLGLGTAAKSGVVQTTGQSEKDVISQKGATDNFALKSLFDHFGGATLMLSGGRDYSLQLSDSGVLSLYSLALNKMVMSWSSSGELVAGTIGFEHVKELKSAAKKDVGNSAGQIPDMSYFELSGIGTDNMIAKLPNGLIIQVFRRNISNSASVGVATINPVTFPTPFPGAVWGVFCTKMTYAQINTSCESVTNSGFSATTCAVSGVASTTLSSAVFLAVGYYI